MIIFDHTHPKIIQSIFGSPEFVQFIPFVHFLKTFNFWVLWPDLAHPILTMPTQKNLKSLINLHGFLPTCKKAANSICSSLSTKTRLATPIFDYAQPKMFNQLLITVNLYEHGKRPIISDTRFFPNMGFVQEHSK